VPRARKLFETIQRYEDGHILRILIWDVPSPVPPSEHRFKYSLFYGVTGVREVLYDNERGKGDHRHYGDHEESYRFEGIETLIADFLSDVRRLRERT
jgi:hypothetical protein